jgi:uncharacterized protein YhhL (DUF1145 family)
VNNVSRTDVIKTVSLVFYLVLIWVAVSRPLTLGANLSQGMLVLMVAVHLLECVSYRELIREAPGSPAWHLLNVFLFGFVHMLVMKKEIRGEEVW